MMIKLARNKNDAAQMIGWISLVLPKATFTIQKEMNPAAIPYEIE